MSSPFGLHKNQGELAFSPQSERRLTAQERRRALGAIVLFGAGIATGVLGTKAVDAGLPNKPKLDVSTTPTTWVPVPDHDKTISGVAKSVHEGDIQQTQEDIAALRGGNWQIGAGDTYVPVPVKDINQNPDQ